MSPMENLVVNCLKVTLTRRHTIDYLRDQIPPFWAFWLETSNNIIFSATTFRISICTPHSLLELRESGDHRGMYGVQIRVFFLVPDFAILVNWVDIFYL
jgi:hypothetical protein